jgi:hypothetical protein
MKIRVKASLSSTGWEPEVVAEALIELANNYMDAVIDNFEMWEPSVWLHLRIGAPLSVISHRSRIWADRVDGTGRTLTL